MGTFFQDLRFALRLLMKKPAFTLVAVTTLALGIGANTAVFSIINASLLKPLPVEQPKRLVSLFTTDSRNPGNHPTSHLNYVDYREQNQVFSGLLAYWRLRCCWLAGFRRGGRRRLIRWSRSVVSEGRKISFGRRLL